MISEDASIFPFAFYVNDGSKLGSKSVDFNHFSVFCIFGWKFSTILSFFRLLVENVLSIQHSTPKDQENFRRYLWWDTRSKAYDSAIYTAYAVATT